MTRICFVQPDGTLQEVDANDGASAMEAAIRNDVQGIPADCGGACACATCHVYIAADWAARIPPASEMENELLELAEDRRANSRLSCQIKVSPELEGLVLNVAGTGG